MMLGWLKTMVSFSPQDKLTKTALFTQWTALVAYGGGGLSLLCIPTLWSTLLAFDMIRRDEGYLRLSGAYLLTLSFIYIIVVRAGSCTSKQGPMLSSIVERLFYVSAALLMFILRGMTPLYFAIIFIILDSTLALLTYCIWFVETPRASVRIYVNDVFVAFKNCFTLDQRTRSSLSVRVIGVLQFIGGAVIMAFPTVINGPLKLKPIEEGSYLIISCSFLLISILGWFHIFAGGADLTSFTIASVFYRVSFAVPLQCILYFCHKIELNLLLFFGTLDSAFALIIVLCFVVDKKKHTTRIKVLRVTQEPLKNKKAANNVIANDVIKEKAKEQEVL